MFDLNHHALHMNGLLFRDHRLRKAPPPVGHLQGPASRSNTVFRPVSAYRPSSAAPCRGATRKAMSPRSGSEASSATTSNLMATPVPDAAAPAATASGAPPLTA